jgi:hypothetical protein
MAWGGVGCTLPTMSFATPGRTFVDAFAPLVSTFGERLSFSREGQQVQWSFDGHTVVVDLAATDWIAAHFIAPSGTDLVSGQSSSAVYAPDRRGYALTNVDCERMVADMIAFFSGTREPRFTFVAAR